MEFSLIIVRLPIFSPSYARVRAHFPVHSVVTSSAHRSTHSWKFSPAFYSPGIADGRKEHRDGGDGGSAPFHFAASEKHFLHRRVSRPGSTKLSLFLSFSPLFLFLPSPFERSSVWMPHSSKVNLIQKRLCLKVLPRVHSILRSLSLESVETHSRSTRKVFHPDCGRFAAIEIYVCVLARSPSSCVVHAPRDVLWVFIAFNVKITPSALSLRGNLKSTFTRRVFRGARRCVWDCACEMRILYDKQDRFMLQIGISF